MIYLNDSYIKEFHAPIVAVEEEKIIIKNGDLRRNYQVEVN